MVNVRLLRAFTCAASLVLLAGCGLFTASTFPAAATQIAAQRDLSSYISSGFSHQFTLSTVTAGGIDLVFLACPVPSDGTHLIVMDKDLNVLQTFSWQDLGLGVTSNPSSTAITGMAGDVSIMNFDWTSSTAGISSPMPLPSPPGAFAVTDGTQNFGSFNASGNTLSYSKFNSAWAYASAGSSGAISSNGTANFNIISLSSDQTSADAVFILSESTSSQYYCVTVPRSVFTAGLSYSPNLLGAYPSFALQMSNNNSIIGFSQNGIILFQQQSNGPGGTFIRLDMSGSQLPDSLRWTDTSDISVATRYSGGWYYVYNRTTRVVMKVNAWWGK